MKKFLALLPFLALMVFVTSCSDDDDDDNPATPTPAAKVLNLVSADGTAKDTIKATMLMTEGTTEEVVFPQIENIGETDVEIEMTIKIDELDAGMAVAACLGNGEGSAECLMGRDAVGSFPYTNKYIVLQANTITTEDHLSIHFQPSNKGTMKGEFIFKNTENEEDVITIPFVFTANSLDI